MLSEKQQQQRDLFLNTTRDMLAWLESCPDMPAPAGYVQWDYNAESKSEFVELRRASGFHKKLNRSDWIAFEKRFGSYGIVFINIDKQQTCERVRVGERIVAATPEHVEPLYEWRCPESLLIDDDTNELVAAESQQPA